ncbi:hypothetical protein ASG19_05865 [Rhizobium sp. Leaf306]|nr:hypothetical protein ASG19_05865 [Rhizobium sp. Leaf306]KQQ73351.1 hypothetical protein ASF70_05810 [Rhizobium sp. Leaf321]
MTVLSINNRQEAKMAESVKSLKPTESQSPSFDHVPSENSAFNSEIASLKSEIANLRDLLAEKGSVAYDRVASRASDAASYVSEEANSVAATVREHPAATTTLITLIGGIGFAIGYLVANASVDSKQAWYQRYINDRF